MKALLILNLQNDFMPWGTVPVEESDLLASLINNIMGQYHEVIAIMEWHPADHISFAANHLWRKPGQTIEAGGVPVLLWTMHCVQESFGAELVGGLEAKNITRIVRKGVNKSKESFNAFLEADSNLKTYLVKRKIEEVHICGLIAEFDVISTALHTSSLGFKTSVLVSLCKGLDKKAMENALSDLSQQGIALN